MLMVINILLLLLWLMPILSQIPDPLGIGNSLSYLFFFFQNVCLRLCFWKLFWTNPNAAAFGYTFSTSLWCPTPRGLAYSDSENDILRRNREISTFNGAKGCFLAMERSSRPPCSRTDLPMTRHFEYVAGGKAITILSPPCAGSTGGFSCQPRVTGLVAQELLGLATKVCARPAHAMPLPCLS